MAARIGAQKEVEEMTETKDAKATYPKTLFQPAPPPGPGFQRVTVTDESGEKALRPPGFATLTEAIAYDAPLEQPIPHIARTGNEEQFDERKSQPGRPIPTGVIRTPAPVQNVFVQTGVDVATNHLTAVVPEGVDASVLTGVSAPGQPAAAVIHDDARANGGKKKD
jgi:hypothetical protein